MVISIVRVVSRDDIKLCFKLRKIVFCDEFKFKEENDVDKYDEVCDHWLAYDNTDPLNPIPVATARLAQYYNSKDEKVEGVGRIGKVVVLINYRGRGIAQQLMSTIENYANSSTEFNNLILYSITDKRGFYSKLGYNLVDPDEAPIDKDGILHVRMIKDIC